jgi:hypothetical protein
VRTRDQDIQAVKDLLFGETTTVFWSEEGGGEVHRISDGYELYEVPQYGGEPHFYGKFYLGEEDRLVDIARTWT